MKRKLIILPAIIALLTVSCSDWLNVVPKTMEPADVMFDTYQGYKDALTGCYVKMKDRSLWGENMTITSVEFLAQHWQFGNFVDAATVTTGTAIKKYDYADDNVKAVFQNIYDGLYNIIVQANTIIEAMPETWAVAIPDRQARAVVEGEAHAIRALCHFEILRLFGQVPGGTLAPVSLPYITSVSREPVAYIDYDRFIGKIEGDLDRAAELLGEYDPYVEYSYAEINGLTYDGIPVGDEYLHYRLLRLNYWAVKGLQARFWLYVGNTAEAAQAAGEVIAASVAGKGFSMESNAGELAGSNGVSHYALPGEGLFMLSNHQLQYYNPDLFATSGSAMEQRLYMSSARMEGTPDVFGLFDEPHAASNNNRFRGVWRQRSHPQWDDPTIYELLKYDQEQTDYGISQLVRKQVMPVLRLSEMYLIAMETSNDITRINELYNTYRTARNITGTEFANKQDVMAMIEREYRREFFGEGQMFFFYKRNNAKSMAWAEKAVAEANYRIPFPATEYQLNDR